MPCCESQINTQSPVAWNGSPTITDPPADAAWAVLQVSQGRKPRWTNPDWAVHRKASSTPDWPPPPTTEPSGETPWAPLWKAPPGKSPRAAIPPAWVHRNASQTPPVAFAEPLAPTTTEPSAETAKAWLEAL